MLRHRHHAHRLSYVKLILASLLAIAFALSSGRPGNPRRPPCEPDHVGNHALKAVKTSHRIL
jgi:hypothetical protein